ncbi:hypothetical protein [Aureliella helgolandensis]|uniref:Uncharacterized protein n=1 Tax=Aureliella helgolandensis TaxID=2527968 RepID=A0A518GDW6_9BACT|nr:hypothetical protein [Aureliella helgolandensis]QDV26747.1 hypothetical protein Q31a_51260 [Aureliella helgolandensis]
MAVIENLDIVLGARTEKLDRGLDRSSGKVKKFDQDVSAIGKSAQAALAPLAQMGAGILAAVPGATAAATAFSAIAAAFATSRAAKIAKESFDTAKQTKAAAASMDDFAEDALKAAVAMAMAAKHSGQLRIPSRSTTGLARYNSATSYAGRRNYFDFDDGKMIDGSAKQISNVPAAANAGTTALKGMSVAGVAAGAAVATAFVAVASAAAAAVVTVRGVAVQMGEIDKIAKSAAIANVTFRELAGFRLLTEESTGKGAEIADKAIQKLQIRLTEAERNGGALDDQLTAIGLNSGELLRAGPIEAMRQLAAATQQMKNPSDQLVLAFRLFEEEGAAYVNTLRAGPAAINASIAAAETLGLTLSESQAKAVEAANDAWGRTKQLSSGVFRQLAAEAAPVLTVINQSILEMASGFQATARAIGPVIDNLAIGAGFAYDIYQALDMVRKLQNQAKTLDAAGILETLDQGFDFGSAEKFLGQINEARAAAIEAANAAKGGGGIDLAAIQAQEEAAKAAAETAKAAADQKATQDEQNRQAVAERLNQLREEIQTLREGATAVDAMRLARQGATAAQIASFKAMTEQKAKMEEHQELLARGAELQKQYATPQQQLNTELADLTRLLDVGAINFATFARASREAAKRIGEEDKPAQKAETPTFGALERGSVAAYSAARANERAGRAEPLQEKANALLTQVNGHLERIAATIGPQQHVGNAG